MRMSLSSLALALGLVGGAMWGAFIYQGLKLISSGPVDLSFSELTEWEHVSASRHDRIPSWEDMSKVKDLFWAEDECVVQFHPPKSEYVNHHPRVLHLWKPPYEIPTPPTELIGPKGGGS